MCRNTLKYVHDGLSWAPAADLRSLAASFMSVSTSALHKFNTKLDMIYRLRLAREFPKTAGIKDPKTPLPIGKGPPATGGSVKKADMYYVVQRHSCNTGYSAADKENNPFPLRRVIKMFDMQISEKRVAHHVVKRSADRPPDFQPFNTTAGTLPNNASVVFMLCGHDALGVNFDGWRTYAQRFSHVNIWIVVRETLENLMFETTDEEWDEIEDFWKSAVNDKYFACFPMSRLVCQERPSTHKADIHLLKMWDRTYDNRVQGKAAQKGYSRGSKRNMKDIDSDPEPSSQEDDEGAESYRHEPLELRDEREESDEL